MSNNTLLSRLTPLIRNLTDLSLKLSGILIAYDNAVIRRYSIKETDYRDNHNTLIETISNVSIYVDFPGSVPFLDTKVPSPVVKNFTFIEDLLPIIALCPWFHNKVPLNIGLFDEIDVSLTDEFGLDRLLTFEVTSIQTDYVEQFVYREYVIVPKREDAKDHSVIEEGSGEIALDPNIQIGKEDIKVYDQYDY